MRARWLAPIVAIGTIVGCDAPEDATPPPEPAAIEFAGKVSPTLIGDWTLQGADPGSMSLKANGACEIKGTLRTPGGLVHNDVTGEWCEKDGKLLMRRKDLNRKELVLSYDYSLKGSRLELSTPGRRTKQVYVKTATKRS